MLNVTQRKDLYALLARLFSYPDAELMEGREELAEAALPLSPAPQMTASRQELEIAYTGLFINRLGGAPAQPFASVYLDPGGRLMGPTSLQVAEAYRTAGLSVEGSAEPPDHLPTELEFLFYLVEQEEKALRDRDLAAARGVTARQADFGRRFLWPWVPEFCRRIRGAEEAHPFYRWGAELLETFCRQEEEWLGKLHPAAP